MNDEDEIPPTLYQSLYDPVSLPKRRTRRIR